MNWLHALVVLPLAAMVSAHRADATQQTAALSACEITEPSTSVPAVDQEGFPFPRGRWYINAERTMWAGIFALAGRALEADGPGHSILWIRPAGADLSVTGQRLDGASPPMRAVLGLVVPRSLRSTIRKTTTNSPQPIITQHLCWLLPHR
jgi:hypothetical protein